MTTMVWAHMIYLAVSAAITVWVGRTLQKHGKVFATNGRLKEGELIDSFTRLLEVGFYLLNFGVINIALQSGGTAGDPQSLIELLSMKIGVVLLALGGVHLVMTMVFNSVRKQRRPDAWNGEHDEDVDFPQRKSYAR